MKVLISGSSGLIGSAVVEFLEAQGDDVVRLVRSKPEPGADKVYWNVETGEIDAASIEGTDAVVHLAGESTNGRWMASKKAKIRNSRVKGTLHLSNALAKLQNQPKVFVSASAVGYYGNRGDEILREDSPPGTGFLAEVVKEWEAATKPASLVGIRVVNTRFAPVLSPKGGALEAMLPPFKAGIGGRIGSGKQYMSWVAIDDAVRAIYHVINTDTLYGPVNVSSPYPVTNEDFTKTLGRILGRRTPSILPAFAARIIFGQMADEVLLSSARVEPARLLATGFKFNYPELEGALRHLLI